MPIGADGLLSPIALAEPIDPGCSSPVIALDFGGAWVAAAEGRIAGAAAANSVVNVPLDALPRELAGAFAERDRHTRLSASSATNPAPARGCLVLG